MSNQAGLQLYSQSLNGLISIDNADTIQVFEMDAEIINVDDLTINNLLTTPQISNTTIGTITQTGSNIITQTGTGTNILKDTNFNGNVEIDGNLILSGILEYDILDVDCENLIVQNDASLNMVNISGDLEVQGTSNFIGDASFNNINASGDLQVDNVLQIFNAPESIVGISQPNNTKHQLLAGTTFTVKANYNIDFTITIVCPIAFQHEGNNTGGVNDTLTKLNSYTSSIYKNGVFLQNANTSSQNNPIPTPSHRFTFGSNGNFTYNKYFTTLTNTFTINHVGSPTDTLYEVFYTFNWTTTQILVTNTSIGFYLNGTTTYFTETGVTTGTTPAIGVTQYQNNWTAPSFNAVFNTYTPVFTPNTNLFENVYQITCDKITTNNLIVNTDLTTTNLYVDNVYVNDLLDVDNVLTADPTIQLQDFIFDKTIITTGLFVGTPTTIYSFEIFGNKRPITFNIDYYCPLALSESGTVGIPYTGLRSTINSTSLTLYRNGVLVSTTSGTKTNTTDPKYNITSAGAYNYKQYVNIIYGNIIGITETEPADTAILYELKMSINNTRAGPSGGTYGYEANTIATGITKSANVTNLETFTNWSAGAYNVNVANQTPIYSTDTGTLTNATLITNNLYKKAEFYNMNTVTGATFTPITTFSFYLLSRAGNIQCNLPYLSNNFTGYTLWMRKAVPSTNSFYIVINADVNGVTFYDKNMTAITTDKTFINEVCFHLLYAGGGIWYSLNHH